MFLLLFLCVVFVACSSDDSSALNEWFIDNGIASSYGLQQEEIYLSVEKSFTGANNSAYLVSSYAALGNTNGVEQMLYFGLEVLNPLSSVWKLRTDSIFYKDIYDGKIPDWQKTINAEFCWREESETQNDTTWLKFSNEPSDCKPIKSFSLKAGTSQDTFYVSLPDEFLNLRRNVSADTLRLLTSIRLLDNTVLRIAKPLIADIPGLLRVAQKTIISKKCEQCLHAGVGESLSVAFNIKAEDKIKIAGKSVVFAELIIPKSSDATGSELERPVPVYVYSSDGNLEDYRVDTAYVKEHGHPNLVFWEGNSLRLQVTQSLRNYVNAANSQEDALGFTLRLGTPMLNPKSYYFYNLSSSKVFSDRFAFALYDFSSALAPDEQVKLRLWFADFVDKK
jgi:hypothetical protein